MTFFPGFGFISLCYLFGIKCPTKDISQLSVPCGDIIFESNSNFVNDSKNAWAIFDDIIPSGIIYCECKRCVIQSVKFLTDNDISFSIRSGGHSYGGYNKENDKVILDLSRMNKIRLSQNKKRLVVEPGVTTQEVMLYLKNTNNTDVVIPVGTCPTVNIGGYAQCGGSSFYSRAIGLSVDYVISADIVLANGELITATRNNEYKDLLYAIRGAGGGSFGVVTKFVFRTNRDTPETVLFHSLFYTPTKPQDLISFFNAVKFLYPQTDVDFVAGFGNAGGNPSFFLYFFYVPIKDGATIDDGRHIINQTRSMFEPNGGILIGSNEVTDSIVNTMSTVIHPSFQPILVPPVGLAIARYVPNTDVITDDWIIKLSNEIFSDLNSSITPQFTLFFNSYGNGAILDSDPKNKKTSFVNRDALGTIGAQIDYFADQSELAFNLGKKYDDYFIQLSTKVYNGYKGNLYNTVTMSDIYSDDKVFKKLVKAKKKYDPTNVFNYEFSIPTKIK
mmetsp:Transcript_99384/g.121602  ORF Transcript_99384/g.121602 Transcript_99384/m.121602 type:complete len:502 (+) Transcript_99384:20-1525(+)